MAAQQPDIVVLDIRLPPTYTDEGTRAAVEINPAHPTTGVLLLSQHVETVHTVDLVARGGFGYLLKDRVLDVADFLAAVERVAKGGSALDPHVIGQFLHRTEGRRSVATLTEREHDVLRLMAEGFTNAGAAKRLFLSERTVEAHIRRLLGKLDIAAAERQQARISAPDRSLTPNAGLAVVSELCCRLGVIGALDAAVGPIKQRERGYGAGELLAGIAAAQLAGEDFLPGC